ncbi:TAXI family TRAP transporter solute-binding subunit [Aestuariispira insulae]|nr:TAXI family TRAP transporter solute-binding subunit [Aestuariispira insulae]
MNGSRVARACLVILGMIYGMAAQAADQSILIGTGGQTGVYYRVGGALCRLINKSPLGAQVKCSYATSGGSVANIDDLRAGRIQVGIVQSDWQYHAFHGSAPEVLGAGEFGNMRALFSLYSEPFTVLARRDAGIERFEDLKGHVVNVGNPGSGQRATLEILMRRMGWTMADFSEIRELKSAEQSSALCAGLVDAIVFTVGHPNPSISEATTACDTNLVSVENQAVDALVRTTDYYARAVIPGGTYKGNPDDIGTFGVGATVVTVKGLDPDLVYGLMQAVFGNLGRFKKMHPSFGRLNPLTMLGNNSAPFHEGALRYYRKHGWM